MNFLVIMGFLAASLSSVAGSDYNKAMLEISDAFPGLIAGSPEVLKVVFDSGAFMDLGKNITPTEAKNQPIVVDWNADKDSYYTLMLVDADAPSRKDPYLRDALPWLVGNIPGKNISAGDILADYVGPAPPKNMGMNRFFSFVFQQPGKIKFNEKPIKKNTIDGRLNFSTRNFVEKYKLGNPVGVNFLTAYYDPYTDVLYRTFNCCNIFLVKKLLSLLVSKNTLLKL